MNSVDLYFTSDGDIAVSPTKDIAVTPTVYRDDAQQVYIRMMTEPGDFVLYPTLGADLNQLYGMPQSMATAEYGKKLIVESLRREGRFQGKSVVVNAAPTGPQTIRFDIFIASGGREILALQIEKDLGVIE